MQCRTQCLPSRREPGCWQQRRAHESSSKGRLRVGVRNPLLDQLLEQRCGGVGRFVHTVLALLATHGRLQELRPQAVTNLAGVRMQHPVGDAEINHAYPQWKPAPQASTLDCLQLCFGVPHGLFSGSITKDSRQQGLCIRLTCARTASACCGATPTAASAILGRVQQLQREVVRRLGAPSHCQPQHRRLGVRCPSTSCADCAGGGRDLQAGWQLCSTRSAAQDYCPSGLPCPLPQKGQELLCLHHDAALRRQRHNLQRRRRDIPRLRRLGHCVRVRQGHMLLGHGPALARAMLFQNLAGYSSAMCLGFRYALIDTLLQELHGTLLDLAGYRTLVATAVLGSTLDEDGSNGILRGLDDVIYRLDVGLIQQSRRVLLDAIDINKCHNL
mmetsp:Transcript_18997/g.57396  ORF Transcript_18997/g.57396 Transcript_18997/m.57396 type:complete len:386 (+) Transcript_18997:2101-3258(+)